MDWQERMTSALEYLERTLTGDIDIEKAAQCANCSPFHFMRMFEIITGQTPAEYVRKRRLSKAALELASSSERILDIAIKYGYDSPDSFTRAFKREFDCLPSEARVSGTQLHTHPPISFTIALKGNTCMEYRIEKGREYRLTGMSLRVTRDEENADSVIPSFWNKIMHDGSLESLYAKAVGIDLGVCGVSHSFDIARGDFTYSIAIETPQDKKGLPENCIDFVIPASTWAKFISSGPIQPQLQKTVTRIYNEWFPCSEREHAGTAEIEFYPDSSDPAGSDYWCEYWVPLK